MRIGVQRMRQRGVASIMAVMLLALLIMLSTVALKRNAGFRRSLRLEEQLTQARYLAESGVEEALHSITGRNSLERKVDEGAIRATWKPVAGAVGQYNIISTGVFRAGELTSPAVTIRARVTLADAGKTGAARIVSWQVERRGGMGY